MGRMDWGTLFVEGVALLLDFTFLTSRTRINLTIQAVINLTGSLGSLKPINKSRYMRNKYTLRGLRKICSNLLMVFSVVLVNVTVRSLQYMSNTLSFLNTYKNK